MIPGTPTAPSISMALQADGKIVVAGGGFKGGLSFNGFGLVRYYTDGALDTSFSGDDLHCKVMC